VASAGSVRNWSVSHPVCGSPVLASTLPNMPLSAAVCSSCSQLWPGGGAGGDREQGARRQHNVFSRGWWHDRQGGMLRGGSTAVRTITLPTSCIGHCSARWHPILATVHLHAVSAQEHIPVRGTRSCHQHPQVQAEPHQGLTPPDSVAWLHSMFSLKSLSSPYLRRKPMVVAASLYGQADRHKQDSCDEPACYFCAQHSRHLVVSCPAGAVLHQGVFMPRN
jgi:hypothetical protein